MVATAFNSTEERWGVCAFKSAVGNLPTPSKALQPIHPQHHVRMVNGCVATRCMPKVRLFDRAHERWGAASDASQQQHMLHMSVKHMTGCSPLGSKNHMRYRRYTRDRQSPK